jgi:hypothetical protein
VKDEASTNKHKGKQVDVELDDQHSPTDECDDEQFSRLTAPERALFFSKRQREM